LDAGVRVLIYSGQYDMVCHHLGTENMLQVLEWSGRSDWARAETAVWAVGKQPAGYAKTHKNLQTLLVLDSGHMVPMDQPARALDMLSRFLANTPFASAPSPLKPSAAAPQDECGDKPVVGSSQRRGGGGGGGGGGEGGALAYSYSDGSAGSSVPSRVREGLSHAAATVSSVLGSGHGEAGSGSGSDLSSTDMLFISAFATVALLLLVGLSCCLWGIRRSRLDK
jgi:hypothetical protein